MAIASKVLPLIGVSFLLLLLPSIESNNPFGFIRRLEGCPKGKCVQGVHHLKLYLAKYGYLDYDQVTKKHADDGDEPFAFEVAHQGANPQKLLSGTFAETPLGGQPQTAPESAIKTYQQMHNLNVTGRVDADTVNQMMKPRCGVADIVKSSVGIHGNNHKLIHSLGRYEIPPSRSKWSSSNPDLHYYIRDDVQVPGTQDIKAIIARAFKTWTDIIVPFTFTQVPDSSAADVEVGFHGKTGLRGNDFAFDGPNGTIAHSTKEKLHYDTDERWSSNPGPTEFDLESIALHEIGHVLGLGHSNVTIAIMFATFLPGEIKRVLDSDDIQGIRDLYETFQRS